MTRAPENQAKALRADLDALRRQVESSWPTLEVPKADRRGVIAKVASLTGYSDDCHPERAFQGQSFLPAVILKKFVGIKTSIHYLYVLVIIFHVSNGANYDYDI